MKKRLEHRRQQHINRKAEARSAENLPVGMQERKLSNGYYAAYACGPLKRNRYINERMEVELAHFKVEVKRRFGNSLITDYKFPKKKPTQSSEFSFKRGNLNLKDQKMIEQWNTIDNYYKKRMKYKTHFQTPSQGNKVESTETGSENREISEILPQNNMSTRTQINQQSNPKEKVNFKNHLQI